MVFNLMSPGYVGRSSNIDASRLVNFMLEFNSKESKAPATLTGTPGTSLWLSLGASVVRGMNVFNNILYVVTGNKLYSISPFKVVSAALGSLATSVGPVIMKNNGVTVSGVGGNQLMIVDGSAGYIYNVNTGVFTSSSAFTGGGFPATGANSLEFMDGYFVVSQPNSMNTVCSDLYDGTNYHSIAVAPIEGFPDKIQSIWQVQEQLFFIKEYSTEIWYDAGIDAAQGFPFSRMTAAVLDMGTPAPYSVAKGVDGLFMLGSRKIGDGPNFVGAVSVVSDTPKIISPPAITLQMMAWKPWSDVIGYCYEQEGHSFYVLTSPSANQTFVYDASIGDPMVAWHERSTYISGSMYKVNRHVSNSYVNFLGNHLVGDFRNGNIYTLASSLYSDNDTPLISFRTAEILSDNKRDLNSLRINRIQVDAEMGVNGNIAFSFSQDGGHTWSSDYMESLGLTGEYGRSAKWRRVGTFPYGMVARFAISDPCKRVLINGYVD